MKRAGLLAVLALGACDPIWGVHVRVRDPANQPIENATLAVACQNTPAYGGLGTSDRRGSANVGSIGSMFPVGCDVYIAKPGYATRRIRYHELCPGGPDGCNRYFDFDLVLPPDGADGPPGAYE